AIQVSRAQEPLAQRRCFSAVLYLAGLRDVLRYTLPAKAPSLPAVERGDDKNPGRRTEQIAARRLAEFQLGMLHQREVLVRQIMHLYKSVPPSSEEIRELAKGILRNPWAEDRFLRTLKGEPWRD